MRDVRHLVALAALAALLLGAQLVSSAARGSRSARSRAVGSPTSRGAQLEPPDRELVRARFEHLRRAPTPPEEGAPSAGARTTPPDARAAGPTVVRGLVRRAGEPVRDFDLLFSRLEGGAPPAEEDWTYTDPDGAYDVELSGTHYAVQGEEGGPWLTSFVVPPGARELCLDLDLPARDAGRR